MNSPFDLPLSSFVLKQLGAETVKVFEQQGGQQGSQGSGTPCEDNRPDRWNILYSDTANDFYLIQVEKDYGTFRIYQYDGSISSVVKSQFLKMLRYEARVDRGALTSSCIQAQRDTYSMPTGFTLLWPLSGYAGQASAPNADYGGMWEAWKDAHIASFSGCTDTDASNYNSAALTEDGSCAWTEDTDLSSNFNSLQHKQTSDKSDDDFIWETKATGYRKRKAGTTDNNDGRNFNYYGIIEVIKKCTSKALCGLPVASAVADRTLPETIISTHQVGTASAPLDWTGFTTDMDAKLDSLQNVVDNLESGYTPICREQINTWDYTGHLAQPCDDAFTLGVTITSYSCEGQGNILKQVYTLFKDGVNQGEWTHTFADGSLSDVLLNTTTGEYPWGDMATQIVDAYEATVEIPTERQYEMSTLSRHKIGDTSKVNFILTVRVLRGNSKCGSFETTTEKYYNWVYEYGSLIDSDGAYTFFTSGPDAPQVEEMGVFLTQTIVVKLNGAVIFPTIIYGPYLSNNDAITARIALTPRPGCTNPDATNYDAAANEDDGTCITPTVCDTGYELNNEGNCVALPTVCDTGYELNNDGNCVALDSSPPGGSTLKIIGAILAAIVLLKFGIPS